MYRKQLNSGKIVRTNMQRLCGFAVSHIVTHYYAASHGVAWTVSLPVALSVCYTSEPCKNGWSDQVAICIPDSGRPNEPGITWGPDANMGRGNFEGGNRQTIVKYRDTPRSSVKTWLNRLRCHLRRGFHGPNASCVTWEVQIPHGKGQFWWIGAPIVNYRHFLS